MGLVRYALYRAYEADRIEAGNSMMALLAGAQLASHLLRLTEGSDRLLPEVFPHVPHIRRFNLTSEAANEILLSADAHLGAMGVPYALAIHEDYLTSALALLERGSLVTRGTAASSRLANQHAQIAGATHGSFDPNSLAQLNTLRLMRNCLIHAGGRASSGLVSDVSTWSATTETSWTKLAKRSPRTLVEGDVVEFGHGEMILALAITKVLDRQVNEMLQNALPREIWADMVVEELRDVNGASLRAPDSVRKLRGIARHHYSPLGLDESELRAALARVSVRGLGASEEGHP